MKIEVVSNNSDFVVLRVPHDKIVYSGNLATVAFPAASQLAARSSISSVPFSGRTSNWIANYSYCDTLGELAELFQNFQAPSLVMYRSYVPVIRERCRLSGFEPKTDFRIIDRGCGWGTRAEILAHLVHLDLIELNLARKFFPGRQLLDLFEERLKCLSSDNNDRAAERSSLGD